jgi:16S rRNA (guanine(966)-N(2))-methyltransferase RsmD
LRVISGKYKGRKLVSVKGLKVRPTSDKLKAAIFNVLFSIESGAFKKEKVVLDLFAGTGALGIEALSRSAGYCYFIDKDAEAVSIIKKNLKSVEAEKEAKVILKDYKSGINIIKENGVKLDIIFMDPPYKDNLAMQAIEDICKSGIFNDGCIIIAEHSIKEKLPERIKSFYKTTEKFYSDKVLSFYSTKK